MLAYFPVPHYLQAVSRLRTHHSSCTRHHMLTSRLRSCHSDRRQGAPCRPGGELRDFRPAVGLKTGFETFCMHRKSWEKLGVIYEYQVIVFYDLKPVKV